MRRINRAWIERHRNGKPKHLAAEPLLASANAIAGSARTLFVTYILISVYVFLTVGATNDEQLLRDSSVAVPFLSNINLPVSRFYQFVPWIFLFVHVDLLLLFQLLGDKLHAFNTELERLPEESALALRRQLAGLPFVHWLSGERGDPIGHAITGLVVWSTLLVLPLLTLLALQIGFLPYHSTTTTFFHRLVLLLDALALAWFWPRLATGTRQRVWRWWLSFGERRPAACRGVCRTASAILLAGSVGFATFVAMLPGERLEDDGLLARWLLDGVPVGKTDEEEIRAAGALPWYSGRRLEIALWNSDGFQQWVRPHLPVFHRNLDLHEKLLVANDPDLETLARLQAPGLTVNPSVGGWTSITQVECNAEGGTCATANPDLAKYADKGVCDGISPVKHCFQVPTLNAGGEKEERDAALVKIKGLDLQGRDLRYADLTKAKLWRADLREARMQKAVLYDAQLQGANLGLGQLQDVDFRFSDLQGADLAYARMQGADLAYAQMQSTGLMGARLMGAVLEKVQLQGADLRQAELQGADLDGAELQGADLRSAWLQGAYLGGARLKGADLEGARLQGASLRQAEMQGANFRFAQLQGADLSVYAQVGSASFEQASFALNDFRNLKISPLFGKKDFEGWKSGIRGFLKDEEQAKAWESRLKSRIDRSAEFPPEGIADPCLADAPRSGLFRCCQASNPEYFLALAQFLGDLACDGSGVKEDQLFIARAVANRVLSFDDRDGGARHKLAGRLLRQDCAGRPGLSSSHLAMLRDLAGTAESPTVGGAPRPAPRQ